jgi:hypothetical protein
VDPADPGDWIDALVAVAEQVLTLYGAGGTYMDFGLLQAEVGREQEHLAFLERQQHQVRLKVVRPLYRQIHPQRHLETLRGVGQDGAAVYVCLIQDPQRFGSTRQFRGWHGLIPDSRQSADSEAKGLHITKAGPDLVKKYAYLHANVARQWDPQIAAIYYDQMVHKGQHHTQAVCACATHLLDRVFAVLQEDRPYELRDVDGTPVTKKQARAIVQERYVVPEAIRQRNNKRRRRERQDQRAERQQKRANHPR